MNLELTDKEKNALLTALNDYMRELRGEIASGGKHEFKEELKGEESELHSIIDKLKALN